MGSKAPYPLFTDGTNIYTTFDGGLTYVTITSGGGGTIHTAAPLSGDGSVGTPATIAGNVLALPAKAADLTDASGTNSPGTDAASQYTLPAVTLTTNRTLTLGTAGSPATNLVVQVIRRDLTANTYAVINGGGGGGTMMTFGASPATSVGASFYYDGTNWNFLNFFYVA